MTDHQQSFAENGIDGEILCECDEQLLEGELGVSRKIQRMKLMKVISGRYSTRKILDGDESYVLFDHSRD